MRICRRVLIRTCIRGLSCPRIIAPRNALIVAPHPDDETLGCGGIINLMSQSAVRLTVLFLTDGESSHQSCCGISKEEVGAMRRRLAVQACAKLGVSPEDLIWFGLPDGQISCGNGGGFCGTSNDLLRLIDKIEPDAIFAPHPWEPWPDHRAAGEILKKAVNKYRNPVTVYYYPVWLWHGLCLTHLLAIRKMDTIRVDISAVLETKRQALNEYFSSVNPFCNRPYCGTMPKGFTEHFLYPYEIFFTEG